MTEMMQRRRATKEELEQGAEEIRQAAARMRTEAAALSEEPIGDWKVDEVRESLDNGPQQQVDKSIEEPQSSYPKVSTRCSNDTAANIPS